jgi:hypothetical protein
MTLTFEAKLYNFYLLLIGCNFVINQRVIFILKQNNLLDKKL